MSNDAIRVRGVMAFALAALVLGCKIETAAPPITVIVVVHRAACDTPSLCQCSPSRGDGLKASTIDFEGNVGRSD